MAVNAVFCSSVIVRPSPRLNYFRIGGNNLDGLAVGCTHDVAGALRLAVRHILRTGQYTDNVAFQATCCLIGVYNFSDFIASYLLFEPRCAPLLRIAALSFPFASVHSCINGYFYGVRKTGVPAATQLTEQLFRVGSVFLIASMCIKEGKEPTIAVAAAGLAIGELSSMLLALPAAYLHFVKKAYPGGRPPSGTLHRKTTGSGPVSYTHLAFDIHHFPMRFHRFQPQIPSLFIS